MSEVLRLALHADPPALALVNIVLLDRALDGFLGVPRRDREQHALGALCRQADKRPWPFELSAKLAGSRRYPERYPCDLVGCRYFDKCLISLASERRRS
jgi:hypothetical protein